MKILFAASEMVPFCKTGGLADVIGALPPALAARGHEVSVMLPGYSGIDRTAHGFEPVKTRLHSVPVGMHEKPLIVSSAGYNGVTVYLLENSEYFDRPGLYGDADGDFDDNGERFIFYARGVIELVKALGCVPDIVHAHDWQAGLIPAYLQTLYGHDHAFDHAATLFTIHNLGYQGLFDPEVFVRIGIAKTEFTWRKMEFWGQVSFLKSGIVYADAVSTVSERYAGEITGEPLGFGLHGILSERVADLYGIVNGIDQATWDPATDPVISKKYHVRNLGGKKRCRTSLLETCGLAAGNDVPMFGMVTRLDSQKGLDILEEAMPQLAEMDIRIVMLGDGSVEHQTTMRELADRYPDRLSVHIGFDNALAHHIYSGADAFLMPSRYEPCGLGQLIALRYGTLPVVHATGGLVDTVRDLDQDPRFGNGFVFHSYTATALIDGVERAAALFTAPGHKRWEDAMRRALAADYSWDLSADRYEGLYQRIGNPAAG